MDHVSSTVPPAGRIETRLAAVDDEFAAEWDHLAVTSNSTPFLRPGWVRAWMSAFEPRRRLHALEVRHDDELVAVLPVLRRRGSLRVPTNTETPIAGPVAKDAGAMRHLVGPLVARSGLRLSFTPADLARQVVVPAAGDRGFTVSTAPLRRSPYTSVTGNWENHQTTLTTSRRRDLRRNERRLQALGELELTRHDGSDDFGPLLQQGLELEAAGWKGAEGTAILSRSATTTFYRRMSLWASSAGLLRLYFLRLDGRPIAFSLNLEQNGTSYGLKTAYAPSHKAFGPGVVMLNRLIRAGFARPEIQFLEHLGEADPFKLEFSTGSREQVSVQVFPAGASGRFAQQAARVPPLLTEAVRAHTTPESRRAAQRWVARLRR